MNRAGLIAQANQMLNNNILNPQQMRWMDKPAGDPSGLAYLKPLDSLVVKQTLSLTECMKVLSFVVENKTDLASFSDGRNARKC